MSEPEGGGGAWTEERGARNERRATREGATPEPPGGDRETLEHTVPIAGGSLYYRTQGQGPPLILVGGGPSNADTLSELAAQLDGEYTVISYDRRGYSRSHLADPAAPVTIGQHADDVRRIIDDLGRGPAVVFGSSIGAVIALELAASAPAAITRLVVHEPPLGQFLTGPERSAFDDIEGGEAGLAESGPSAEAIVNAVAAGVGVRRGAAGAPESGAAGTPGGTAARTGIGASGDGASGGRGRSRARAGDVELFVRRDMPAVGQYYLEVGRLGALAGRVVVVAGRESRGFYPYLCAERLAGALGLVLAEVPGHHAGMIQGPGEFAVGLRGVLGP
jgi:pimeloyl-ACP methyl ester carboxylesterase